MTQTQHSVEDGRDAAINHSSGWLVGNGHVPLYYQSWQPPTKPRAAVLIAHGLGHHGGRYTGPALSLAKDGHAVYALDQRGHGRSGGPRTAGRIRDSIDDLSKMITLIRRDSGTDKVFLIGHSWGGLLALTYAVDHQNDIDGLILSAPAARPRSVSAVQRMIGKLLSGVAPNAGVLRIPFDKASRDPAVIKAFKDDPLVYQGPVRARMASQTLAAMKHVTAGLPGVTIPVLLLQGTDDVIVTVSTSQYVHDRIGSPDRSLELYEGLWHQLFHEPERETVYADVKSWLSIHLSQPAPE